MGSDDPYAKWTNEKLLKEYASIIEFRVIESQHGQVSPAEMRQQAAVKEEILRRMAEE